MMIKQKLKCDGLKQDTKNAKGTKIGRFSPHKGKENLINADVKRKVTHYLIANAPDEFNQLKFRSKMPGFDSLH